MNKSKTDNITESSSESLSGRNLAGNTSSTSGASGGGSSSGSREGLETNPMNPTAIASGRPTASASSAMAENFSPTGDYSDHSRLVQAPPSADSHANRSDSNDSRYDASFNEASTHLPKKYFCRICNQGFSRKHNMVSHELIHSSTKPHICRICHLKFRRIHDLKRHEKLHTGEKPFRCDKCSRLFARPDALSRHQNSPNACSGNVGVHDNPRRDHGRTSSVDSAHSDSHPNSQMPSSIATIINRETYDLNRWKASQYSFHHHQQQQQGPHQFQPIQPKQANPFAVTPQKQNPTAIVPHANVKKHPEPERREVINRDEYYPVPYIQNPLPSSIHLAYDPLAQTNPPPPAYPENVVCMAKYQELVAYTRRLEENLANMDSRLKLLEQTNQVASSSSRDANENLPDKENTKS